MRMLPLVVTTSLLSLTLALGCTAEGESAPPGTDGVGGSDGSTATTLPGGDGGTSVSDPSDPPTSNPPTDPVKPAQDGGVPPVDGSVPPVPVVGKGFVMTVGGQTYNDPDARARRSKFVSGPNAGTYSGLTYVPTPIALLQQFFQLSFDVKGGGNGYLAVGTYSCSASGGSQTPIGRSSITVLVPGPKGYTSKDGGCVVKITSAGASAAGPWRITGTIDGKLVESSDKVTEATVSGGFDLVYEN